MSCERRMSVWWMESSDSSGVCFGHSCDIKDLYGNSGKRFNKINTC